jgi:hypothetical protein
MKSETKISKEISKSTEAAVMAIASAAAEATKVIACAAGEAKLVVANSAMEATNVINKRQITDESKTSVSSFIYKQLSFGLSVVAIVIGAFIYLTDPTKDNDTALQLQDQRIEQQQKTIDGLNLTMQNDTKELKNEVAGLRQEMQTSTNEIVELKTIINERIPAKK